MRARNKGNKKKKHDQEDKLNLAACSDPVIENDGTVISESPCNKDNNKKNKERNIV